MENLPFPPDQQLRAIEEAIVDFFPSGRHSHVREMLAGFNSMESKTDELTIAKVQSVLTDEKTMEALKGKVDRVFSEKFRAMIDSPAGT
jgi:hypothetical protein